MSVFDEPITILDWPEKPPEYHVCLTQFVPGGEEVRVWVVEDDGLFRWEARVVWLGHSTSMEEGGYDNKTNAIVALCFHLFDAGYDRLAHGILAEEWE